VKKAYLWSSFCGNRFFWCYYV